MNVSYPLLFIIFLYLVVVECKRFPTSSLVLGNTYYSECFLRNKFAILFCTERNSHEDDSYVRSKSSEQNRNDYVERTRRSVQKVIRSSWSTVKQLGMELAPGTLQNCEEELRKATSLLVLATVRRQI